MLSVANKSFTVNVVILGVIMLDVTMLSVVAPLSLSLSVSVLTSHNHLVQGSLTEGKGSVRLTSL